MHAWAIPKVSSEPTFFDLPVEKNDDGERAGFIREWNAVLKDAGGLSVGAGARFDLVLV